MPPKRKLPSRLETDPMKMLERLVGLPEVTVLGLFSDDARVELHIESIMERPGCPEYGVLAQLKGWREVVLVDLQFAGKATALHWHKRRWRCVEEMCSMGSWTEQDDRIAHSRMKMTRGAALRATEDVGRKGRTVTEVAEELGCDWHTINDVVIAYGEALVDHPGRFSDVAALGLDETAFVRAFLPPHRVRDFDRGREGRSTPRPGARTRWSGTAGVAHGSGTPMARQRGVRDPGSLGCLQGRARRLSTKSHPGGRPFPPDQAGQRTRRRVSPAHPKRGLGAPRAKE